MSRLYLISVLATNVVGTASGLKANDLNLYVIESVLQTVHVFLFPPSFLTHLIWGLCLFE